MAARSDRYWIAFGGLLPKEGDWRDGLFLVTKGHKTWSFVLRFTGELERRWGLGSLDQAVRIIKRYGFRAVKDELDGDNELDGYMIMLSSDTCLEDSPNFLEAPKYDSPQGDMTSYVAKGPSK